MCPPPLSRTSTIRPFCGSSAASRTNSSRNATGSCTLNVKIRRCPKVPDGVTDLAGPEDAGHRGRHVGAADRGRGRELGRALAAVRGRRRRGRTAPSSRAAFSSESRSRPIDGRGRADRVEVRHRRQVGGDLPLLAQFLGRAVETDVGQRHPVLVRRRLDDQRPQGERLQPAGEVGRVVAAGEHGAVQRDGAGDRRTVPVRHLGTRAELRRLVAGDGPGDQVVLGAGRRRSTSRS